MEGAESVGTLRARVASLEKENSALRLRNKGNEDARKQVSSLQGELQRVQHLCNELCYTMVLQGVDPSVLSSITRSHLLFDPAVPEGGGAAASPTPSTPRSVANSAYASASGSARAVPSAALDMRAVPSAAYQLAPVPAPARAGAAQFRGLHATPPDAFIPDSLRKRLDASSALATRLGSPAMMAGHTPEEAGNGGSERVFLGGGAMALDSAFDAAAAGAGNGEGGIKPSPPPHPPQHGDKTGGEEGYREPGSRTSSANGGRRTHSRGRRLKNPSPLESGLGKTEPPVPTAGVG